MYNKHKRRSKYKCRKQIQNQNIHIEAKKLVDKK